MFGDYEEWGGDFMSLSTNGLDPLVALLFGILILIFPKFLNYFIAAYLIIIGVLGLGILS